MKIKIYKNCLDDSHVLYMNDKKRDFVIADRKETDFSAKRFKFKVCDMVSDWEQEMVNPDIIDGVEYTIVIKREDNEKTYHFKNKFPADILRLESLIEEVVEAVTYGKD